MNPLHYQAKVLASALRLYARTGMKANSAYTPSAMLATAGRITGQVFKRGQHLVAADALANWVRTQHD
jgi:hypothetical protein